MEHFNRALWGEGIYRNSGRCKQSVDCFREYKNIFFAYVCINKRYYLIICSFLPFWPKVLESVDLMPLQLVQVD